MANRLADATSPYLLQHAENPVDWYPWGEEAFARAAAEDRPVFLSVGYAACHWCHVMAHESFEDPATASELNSAFVSIKVDREERPDVDSIYMAAVQAMTGNGGWPMSVFLTPDGRPFYGGTYFPSEPRYGMPSFRQLVAALATAWHDRRDEVEQAADQLADALRGHQSALGQLAVPEPAGGASISTKDGRKIPIRRLEPAAVETAVAVLARDFDPEHGGWGGAPKFPQPATLEMLLRRGTAGNRQAMQMCRTTLDAMAAGGIHDHLGGGFHRYSTDAAWLVPHFEKMLYDNAQLARVYLHAWQATGEARYREVAERTLDYLDREMTTPEGLFAASQDADTAGVEGATFVWTRDEVSLVLAEGAPSESDDRPPVHTTEFAASTSGRGDDSAPPDETVDLAPSAPAQLDEVFSTAYGVNELGNWEGRTILSRVRSDDEVGALYGLSATMVDERLAAARAALLSAREARPQPGRDDKAIAAWNGLALAAFADAAAALGSERYRTIAERVAAALLRHLGPANGRLARSFRAGRTSGQALLEDYAFVADGMLALYEATFDERWIDAARDLMAQIDAHFADPQGGWFDTADDHERLLLRPKDLQDGATPSGNAAAVLVLLRLAELTGEGRQRSEAERALEAVQPLLPRYPLGFGAWLVALDFAVSEPVEVAIVGDPARGDARALIEVASDGFAPYRVLAAGDPSTSSVELIQGRFRLNGNATAFVCRQFACRQPVTEPAALAAQLSS